MSDLYTIYNSYLEFGMDVPEELVALLADKERERELEEAEEAFLHLPPY